jgi:hypothetical protein
MSIIIVFGVMCFVVLGILILITHAPPRYEEELPRGTGERYIELKIEQLQERIKELELEEKCQCQ